MVGKVQRLAFRRILWFVISSYIEGVMAILLPKGHPRISTRVASANGSTSKIKLYHLRRNGVLSLIWLERYGS